VTFKKSPFGVTLAGCPLEEKISEFHTLKAQGQAISALAVIVIDNPTVAATGHRICNDCMKACIYQKQEPVNIPQIESRNAEGRGSSCPGDSRSTRCSRAGIRSTSGGPCPCRRPAARC